MHTIRLHFSDFSDDFVPEQDFFYKLISRSYDIILDRKHPDFLIYSCYGYNFLHYDCTRIFYTAENIRPDFNICDYAIGFDYLDFGDRYLRFPNYARYGTQFESLIKKASFQNSDLEKKQSFCNFIYSNSFADPLRDEFFHKLSEYKRVDSLGKHLNNLPNRGADRYAANWRNSKVEMQRPYKFSIAFENSSAPGYTTEKLMHAFIAGTVPIYWGDPCVTRQFNRNAFINCHDFQTFEEVIRRVVVVDNDNNQYIAMLNEPCMYNNCIPKSLTEETILSFFSSIFSQSPQSAFRRPRYGTTAIYESYWREAMRIDSYKKRLMRIGKLPVRVLRCFQPKRFNLIFRRETRRLALAGTHCWDFSVGAIRHNGISAYWYRDITNFGDLITPLLLRFYGFTPIHASPARAELVGAGSILEHLSNNYDGIILGSGFIDESTRMSFPNAKVLAVRGELSRERLGLAHKRVPCADPGLLASDVLKHKREKKYAIGMIPHHNDGASQAFSEIISRLGASGTVIDVQGPALDVFARISECEYVLSSSLHGLIVADSLGIPNRWLASDNLLGGRFKFDDYYSGFGVRKDPASLSGGETVADLLALVQPTETQHIQECKEVLRGLWASLGEYI